MKIHKIGHCCLIVEANGKRIMTDPGSFTSNQNQEMDIDIILFTHEHQDHLHMESLKAVLQNNPQAKIITNTSVGKILDTEKIPYTILEHGNSKTEEGVLFEAYGEIHDEIFGDAGRVQNTGYFIENKLFYPGDALTNPGKPVDVLALPISGPWVKIKDVVNYVMAVKPKRAFPVHDGILNDIGLSLYDRVVPNFAGTMMEFVPMKAGDTKEF